MNDRPDWLPEPTTPPVRPLSERLHLGAISVASLLLAIFGILLLVTISWSAWTLLRVPRRQAPIGMWISPAILGLASLGVAYLLRWCLWRERERRAK